MLRPGRFLLPLLVALVPLALATAAQAGDVTLTLDAGFGFIIEDDAGATERLRIDEATGDVSRNGVLFLHTSGDVDNTFLGDGAGNTSTTAPDNTAYGADALSSIDQSRRNVAMGTGALQSLTDGSPNASLGGNVAVGFEAAQQTTTAVRNVAIGYQALRGNTTGSYNVAIGDGAGISNTTGGDNIYISNPGVAGESGVVRIGGTFTSGPVYIEGVNSSIGTRNLEIASDGRLIASTSSQRFKRDIEPMGDRSRSLLALRPVTFRYREEHDPDQGRLQFGLIAEQVAEVMPDLVLPDAAGDPHSVRYTALGPLLLNEIQRLNARLEELEQRLADAERAR